jgi:hypothetical protein
MFLFLAILARPTAATCSSPRIIFIFFVACLVSGISTFSNKFTFCVAFFNSFPINLYCYFNN